MHDVNIRIVRIECPYDHWDDALCRDLFTRMITLKLQGYRSEYPYGVLPLDTFDFIATHLLLCQEVGGSIVPLSGYKSISLERCQSHRAMFPLLSLLRAAEAHGHAAAVEEIVQQHAGKAICYDYSYTMLPEARHDREIALHLRDLLTAMHLADHLERRSDVVFLTGVNRFKMPRLFEHWGYEPMSYQGKLLGPFQQISLFGEEVTLVRLKQFSAEAMQIMEKHSELWERRIVIGKETRR